MGFRQLHCVLMVTTTAVQVRGVNSCQRLPVPASDAHEFRIWCAKLLRNWKLNQVPVRDKYALETNNRNTDGCVIAMKK